MNRGWLAWMAGVLALAGAGAGAPALRAQVPDAVVAITDPVVLPAGAKGRRLLVRVSAPAHIRGRAPVILFSHGAALNRDRYAPLVEAWARAGYVVLAPDHEDGVIDGFPPPPPSAQLWRTRIGDLRRLAHALPAVEAQVPALRGHLDARKLLVAGHSFGGHTASALVGARVRDADTGKGIDLAEPLIRGAVLLSPPGAGKPEDLVPSFGKRGGFLDVDWAHLRGPVLVIVGSEDDSAALTVRGPAWHADIYRKSAAKGMCLLTLTGGRHYLGGIVDPRRTGMEDADPARLALVRRASLALFADALAGRAPAAVQFQPLGTPGDVECR
ncbi:MAG TPA: hypothetical protein VN222_08970 [Novosphingobium sp.]|nr:hypothetical protein [Novosphingobium sp.]